MKIYEFRFRIGILILFLALLFVPVAAELANTAWPKFQHDLQNTGRSQYTGSQSNTTKWIYTNAGDFWYVNPVIGFDGTIYIGSQDANLRALDPNGTQKWQVSLSSSTSFIYGSPAIGADGTIYVESNDYKLFAINPNGTKKWQSATFGTSLYGSPAIGADGTIYVGADALYSFDPQDGTLKWSNTTGTAQYATPAIGSDGTIYIGSESKNTLYAYNPDGTLKWSNSSANVPFRASPVIGSDGTIYIGSSSTSKFYAFNSDGTLKWSNTTGGKMYGSAAVGADGTIYVGCNDKKVYAWNPDGTLKWSYTTGGVILWASPAIGADGTIYIGSRDGKIYALNPTGTLKWFYLTNGVRPDGSPSIGSDGTLYITSYSGSRGLYAFTGVVDFSASPINGSAPLSIKFIGSSPLAVTTWHWDFGDGMTSDEQNPEHSYANPGSYTVKLTITHASGTNYAIKSDYIKVYSPPAAGFTSDVTSGKSPFTVQFTDTSTGSPTLWHWDFGDGVTSDIQNPTHSYSTTGTDTVTYTVNLTATNLAGSNKTSKTGYITLYSTAPVVSFTGSPRVSGKAPLTVQFHDTSTLQPTAWLWDFGDGSNENATMQNPVHTYASSGTYMVNLTAKNAIGWGTNLSKPGFITVVTPGPINMDYPYLYVANDEGVKYDINGTNLVYVPNTYSFATMGGLNALHISSGNSVSDITTTTNQSGTFYFTHTGGQSTVPEGILMLAVNGTIPDDFRVHIRSSGDNWTPPGPAYSNGGLPSVWNYVEGAVDQTFTKDDFIYGPQSWKPDGYPIYYGEDQADPINQFRIMFIDLNAGKAYDNIKIEYAFTNLTSFAAFNAYGWYLASNHGTMIMTNDVLGGSTYGASGYSVIGIPAAPVAGFSPSTTSEYNLVPIRFTDTSANVPQSWLWDFGDGTTSTLQNPSHPFASGGTYSVKLTATNIKGTDLTTRTINISVPPVPVADFTADVTSGISPVAVQFNDTSTNSPVAWSWDFGDGITSTEQNPIHWYAPGTYTVNLTVMNGGGNDSLLKTNLITVTPSVATNRFSNPGFETGDLTDWTAGVGYTSVSSSKVHTGNYAVFFDYMGHTTYDYIAQHVDLTDISNISFWGYEDGSSSYNQYFKTYIDGVLVQTDICAHSWTQYRVPISGYTGVHLVQVAFDVNSLGMNANIDDFCAGSATTCGGSGTPTPSPVASFTATQVNGVAPLAVTFTDTSTNSPTSWSWNFGDTATSTYRDPTHTYGSAGTYPVKLTVTNAGGSSTVTKAGLVYVVNATGPVPGNNKTYIRTANHDGIRFNDNDNGTYYLPTGSGGLGVLHLSTDPADTSNKITITNSQSGTFYITGDSYEDEVVLLLAVNGTIPDDFTARIKTSGYTWTPVSGKAPSAGTYTYQSTALDQTFTKADLFYGPQSWKPTQGNADYPLFKGEEMNSPASQYRLMFIDTRSGLLSSSPGLKNNGAVRVDYAFTNLPDNAVFNVYGYRASSGMGWTNPIDSGYSVTAKVIPPVADFAASQTEGIAPFNPRFRDTSLNTPTGWAWDFGDDGTSAKQIPDYTYTKAGTYSVKLNATNSKGSDTKIRTNYITVINPVSTNKTFELPGIVTNATGSSQGINISAANATIDSTNTNIVTVDNVGTAWDHLKITLDAPAVTDSGNVTGTVKSLEAVATNVSVNIDSLGKPNVTLTLTLSQLPNSSAAINSTITSDPDSSVWSSFTILAASEKKNIIATAYTVYFSKSGIDNYGSGGIIKSANITMAVNHTWVEDNGGTSRIKVMHRSDEGTVTFLATEWTGLCAADGNDYFVAISPTGLSTFVLTAYAPVTTTTSSSSSSSWSYYEYGDSYSYYPPTAAIPAVTATGTATATPTATPVQTEPTKQKVRITPWPTEEVQPAPQQDVAGVIADTATAPGKAVGLWKNPWFLVAEAIAAIAILTVAVAGYIRKRRRDRDPLRWEYK
ncbi:PKD domain-containing protein [Methanoregula formicica]|uniref:PDK repeat-containing protein n=1 Tax=Methanoregula formicica (strain DSM 22288 / NBRC 105244 / SMSP) TaxID=593750 RepID=L0HDK4_METFS|nr:PKD domain-containing protein [Methanoregula formicica]AGB02802.1 PDK repeat-containing protein [Methanoregula formicica SMSP]